ncbi:MAG: Holo-(acyl-carrier-protein) synthase [Pelotomaculum sp. PtaU1.Bin035]|nr:MAG: Holo-(acyl-carrier-protein) synthase [Pelotomaculum sp. PtaU1.Bin035]
MPGSNGIFLPTSGLFGVGTDIVEIERVKQAAVRSGGRFLKRVFTISERNFCDARRDRFACYAARFAAKEAVFKAIGTGLAGSRWTDVEIGRKTGGCPTVLLHGAAAAVAEERGIGRVLLSLSHDRDRALAFVVAEREEA